MTITYHIEIDQDDDGQFSSAEAITPQVLGLHWRLGLSEPYQHMARPAWAQITVRNHDRQFSPELSALLPGKRLRILSDDGAQVRVHFTGSVTQVAPMPGDWGAQMAVIYARDALHSLSDIQVRLPPLVDVRADEAIAQVLARCDLRYPSLSGYIILGGPDGRVGQKLFGVPLVQDFQAGRQVLPIVGDGWGAGIAADSAINQIAAAERGRFSIDREGRAVFRNRHHTLLNLTPAAQFDNAVDRAVYVYGDAVISQVEGSVTPRTVGAAGVVVWSLGMAQAVPPRSTRRISARYGDADGNPLGVLALDGLSYAAHADPAGSGRNLTAQVRVRVIEAGASAAVLDLTNTGDETAYLTTLTLSGQPVVSGPPLTITHRDRYNLTHYGHRALHLNLPLLASMADGDQIARYELVRRRVPRGTIREVELSTRGPADAVLSLSLFDRIRLHDSQTGHSGDYFIIAEEHRVEQGGHRHRVRWLLEPADDDRFFIVGQHAPDGSRCLMI